MSLEVKDERVRAVPLLGRLLSRPELGAVAGTVLIFVFFGITAGDSGLFSAKGIVNFLEVSAQLGILAAAVALLMIGGEFDLSLGSMIGFAGIIIGLSDVSNTGCRSGPQPWSHWSSVVEESVRSTGLSDGQDQAAVLHRDFGVDAGAARPGAIAVTRYVAGYTQISKITATNPGTASSSRCSAARWASKFCSAGWRPMA